MGENSTKVCSFETVEILMSINFPYQLKEIILLEVGNENFLIRIKERGITELKNYKLRKGGE